MKLLLARFIIVVVGTLLWSALPAYAETLGFSISQASRPVLEVEVRDDRTLEPISEAQIVISDSFSKDDPALQTDMTPAEGISSFSLNSDQLKIVTVTKPGYAAISVAGLGRAHVTVFLKHLKVVEAGVDPGRIASHARNAFKDGSRVSTAITSGTMGDYPVPRNNSLLRAAFVFRNISIFDLLDFQMNDFVSPLNDAIHAFGSHDIPSNLIFPLQKLYVVAIPVTLDKQHFRFPVAADNEVRLVGIQGEMPTRDLIPIGLGGGQTSTAMFNQMNFTRLGVTEAFTPTGDMEKNVPASMDLTPAHQIHVSRPPFESDVMLTAMTDLNGDRRVLVPTDIKVATSDSEYSDPITLKSTSKPFGRTRGVVAIAMANDGRRISGVIIAHSGKELHTGNFLPALAPKDFKKIPANIKLLSTDRSVTMAQFLVSKNDNYYPIWTVYSLPAAGEITIPTKAPCVSRPAQGFAISQLEFSPEFREDSVNGQTIMMELTRFNRTEYHVTVARFAKSRNN